MGEADRAADNGLSASAQFEYAGNKRAESGAGRFVGNLGRRVMNPKLKNAETDLLCEAILSLQTTDECYAFLEDILTVSEIQSVAQRLQVAKMLDEGQTYDDIERLTGASSATISRVKRSLMFGADGYRLVLDRLKGTDKS
ncbi:TrpR like protein, YerC/YecD [Sulfobacillus acidophilus DSM 10332]|uniref:TrpR like protein, YerC/YecD n=2 Tax=Bacteria TaxID=2 RepID=G8TXC5_SULAD|nr:TrpR like protein, YerC/YecD [Sulfobacillus acidophilus DSM 10332]